MKKHLKPLILKHGNDLINAVMSNDKMHSLMGGYESSCPCNGNTNLACTNAFNASCSDVC